MALRNLMQDSYMGWRQDLLPAWRWNEFFQDAPQLADDAIPEVSEVLNAEAVWPGRRGANAEAHICRPFEGVRPADVRVIILGQDPYPDRECATGRSFEDGTPDALNRQLRSSLSKLVLSAWDDGSQVPANLIHSQQGRNAFIRQNFDRLAGHGVLFLNAAWTHSDKDHIAAHLGFWQPVVSFTLRRLMQRAENPPVILLLGRDAQLIFDQAAIPNVAQERVIRAYHPTARRDAYLRQPNPLTRINQALALQPAGLPISWLE